MRTFLKHWNKQKLPSVVIINYLWADDFDSEFSKWVIHPYMSHFLPFPYEFSKVNLSEKEKCSLENTLEGLLQMAGLLVVVLTLRQHDWLIITTPLTPNTKTIRTTIIIKIKLTAMLCNHPCEWLWSILALGLEVGIVTIG